MTPIRTLAVIVCLGACLTGAALAQGGPLFGGIDDTRAALKRAQAQAVDAERRGARLEREARAATRAAEKTAHEAAALAARIQQAEAGMAAAEARIALIDGQRRQLQRRLAERREPLVRLSASLQKLARRPLALSALKPGSLRETVYLRALIETTIPQVRARTAALRGEIARGQRLEAEARQALVALAQSEEELAQRQRRLAALETNQRLESRRVGGAAAREAERALALAEQARDLDSLVERLDDAGNLRAELAALPGPVLRPADPTMARLVKSQPQAAGTGAPSRYALPVTGRIVTGFGAAIDGGALSQGIAIAPRPGAQVTAPAQGRVAFAGPFRGYGRIVILEHGNGWTSLVTGLARVDVTAGDELVGGAPLGVAAPRQPLVSLELRRAGKPVNPLELL